MDFIDEEIKDFDEELIEDNSKISNDIYFDDSIKAYLNEISKKTLLSDKEEKELFNLYRETHDKKIFNHICEANLKLVVPIASKYYSAFRYSSYFNVDFLDLIQEGNLGLMYAIDGFTYGNSFSTYATYCIKAFILRSVYNKASMIRMPVYLVEKKYKIEKAIEAFTNINSGNKPTIEELSILTGLNHKEIERCLCNDFSVISLNTPTVDDEEECLEDIVASSINIEDEAINEFNNHYISEILDDVLSTRNADIIKKYYGFENQKRQTFEEISKCYGVTRERIKQINNQTLTKLRECPKVKKLGKDFF